MSFIMDMLLKQGINQMPKAIEKLAAQLQEGEAIMIIPARVPNDPKAFVCIGKFDTRVVQVVQTDKGDQYKLSLQPEVTATAYVLPEETEKLIAAMSGE